MRPKETLIDKIENDRKWAELVENGRGTVHEDWFIETEGTQYIRCEKCGAVQVYRPEQRFCREGSWCEKCDHFNVVWLD